MQVRRFVIQWVAVNVVDYIALLSACDFSVFPLSTVSLRAIAETLRSSQRFVAATTFFNRRISFWLCFDVLGYWTYGPVSLSLCKTMRQTVHFALICIQRIAMPMKHLVVAHTKLLRNNRPIAILTGASYSLPSPGVFRGAILLDSLVVHKAEPVGGMLAPAFLNRAGFI